MLGALGGMNPQMLAGLANRPGGPPGLPPGMPPLPPGFGKK